MNETRPDPLREKLWRLKDIPSEQASNPDLALEAELTRLLARQPSVPVSSNFNTRVWQKIQHQEQPASSPVRSWFRWLQPRWAAGLATACILLFGGVLVYRNADSPAVAVSNSLAVVSEFGGVPNPEILQDFDAIRALSASPGADQELLALMQ